MEKMRRDTAKPYKDSLEPLAEDIKECAFKLRGNKFLSSLRTTVIVTRAVKRRSSAWGVSATGFGLLHSLIASGGRMTPTQISKQMLLSKYSVTRVADVLEAQGLIRRESYGYDLRTRDLVITRKGLDMVNKRADYFEEHMLAEVLRDLNRNQMEDLIVLLQRLKKIRLPATVNSGLNEAPKPTG